MAEEKVASMDIRIKSGLALAVLGAAFLLTGLRAAYGAGPETLRIEAPWARETAAGQRDGGGFMTIINTTASDDQLVGATSPASEAVQIHTVQMENGMMRMRELPDGIPVPAAARVELKPGSLHIMFIKLKQPLKAGEQLPVTLKFRVAGEKTVRFEVRSVAAMPRAAMPVEPKVPQ
jgi:periplasmic copper chaperone A